MKQLFLVFLLSFFLLLGLDVTYSLPAHSLIRQINESPEQVLYQARNSLRDSQGDAWQVVLFKRVKDDQLQEIHLRLVGFPEKVRFLHPKNLTLTTGSGQVFSVEDVLGQKAPGANVGEYNMKDILGQIKESKSLSLELPLEKPVKISIPLPVLLEWEEIN